MVTMFSRHPVADYAAWRKVFDEARPTRESAGVVREAVYRSADDPNQVTLVLDFETIEAARAFPDNPALRAAFQEAGSVGPPTDWFAEKA
jgi:quinol monooxygenase YgiN